MGGVVVPIRARLERNRRIAGDCWIWTSSKSVGGYGLIRIGLKKERRTKKVHRVAYEEFIGPIPEGLDLDHLCRVRDCFNPSHLEPVTRSENLLRGDLSNNGGRLNWIACPKGHAYTPDNTYIDPRGTRNCRACRRAASRRYEERQRQLAA